MLRIIRSHLWASLAQENKILALQKGDLLPTLHEVHSMRRKAAPSQELTMNNVIPLRPDPLRNLYELIDSIHDTQPTPEQKRITDEALALVQKMIEAKHGDSERRPTPA